MDDDLGPNIPVLQPARYDSPTRTVRIYSTSPLNESKARKAAPPRPPDRRRSFSRRGPPRGRFQRISRREEPLEYPAGEAFLVSGRLALACHGEGGIEIIDFKVRTARGLEDLKPRYQLDTYALAAAYTFGANVERLVIHLLAEAPGKELVSWRWDADAERTARERAARAADGIAARRFETTPGPHCRYCDFKAICPASQARDRKPAETVGAAP